MKNRISEKVLHMSLMFLLMAALLVLPASAALQAVGAIDPANGFPYWFQDSTTLKLAPCLGVNADGSGLADPNCVLPIGTEVFGFPEVVTFDSANPILFPNNFPSESFYYIADAPSINVGTVGANIAFRMALEGAFASDTGAPAVDQQIAFLRINMRVSKVGGHNGLAPNSAYIVNHPFGTFTLTTDAAGDIISGPQAFRAEDGAFSPPLTTATATTFILPATNTNMGPFLKQVDPAPPLGYIGDGTLATIDPGPNGAIFSISGPNVDGAGGTLITSNLWTVSGKIFDPIQSLTSISITPPAVTVPVGLTRQFTAAAFDQFSDPMAATFTWTTDSANGSVDATGLFTALSTGPVNVIATNGTLSANAPVTVSVFVPVLTTINVTPLSPTLIAGQTQQFVAAALDQLGNPIFPTPTIVWTTSDPFVGTINPSTGLFASMGVGSANVTASNGTVNGSSTVTVVSSALQGVGPADPANGFPLWYLDNGGTRIGQCIAGANGLADPLCIVLADATYNPSLLLSFPTNFPGEAFYWIADSDTTRRIGPGGGGRAKFRMALEGTFASGTPQVGQQITFLRINMQKTSNLAPNAVYNVTYPFGNFSFRTDNKGATVNTGGQAFRREDGSFAPGAINVFSALLPATNTNISLFLKAVNPAPPAGYLGNPAILQTITPGPNGAFLRINGTDIGGRGINTITIPLWNVAGKNFTGSLMPSLYSIDPANKAINVPADKTIVATFDKNIEPGTTYSLITLKETKSGKAVAFTKTIVNNLLFIDPINKLQGGLKYTVFLPQNAVEYTSGTYLPRDYSSTFTVAYRRE
jgi:hypothetical protein